MLEQNKFGMDKSMPIREAEALQAQLGSPADLDSLQTASDVLKLQSVNSVKDLQLFLREYQDRILFPIELPIISRAHQFATASQARELMAMDLELSRDTTLAAFAKASHSVGRKHLHALRHLKDQRFIQKYRDAVESGKAKGWHTVVFGLVLAVYSLPLMQGVHHYAQQTLFSFVDSAARKLSLPETEVVALKNELENSVAERLKATASQFLPASFNTFKALT